MPYSIKKFGKTVLNRMGYDVRHIGQNKQSDDKNEGFDKYLAAANEAGMDVNDWIESVLHWVEALPILKELVFPYVNAGSCICEIGPGTGRHARYIIPRIPDGKLHLFDHSSWIQNFLANYFAAYQNVFVHDCDGHTLDMPDRSVDVVFSNGTFIELKLGEIYLYAKEFARVVKANGYVIFDYIDISTREGWQHLETQSTRRGNTFTYHSENTINELFANAGFTLTEYQQHGKSKYVVFRKL